MIVADRVPGVSVRYVKYSIASQRAPAQGTQQLNLKPAAAQVLFVAFGRLMYLDSPDGVLPWFSGRLGFPYGPAADGLPSDWVMDMVSPDLLTKKVSARSLTQPRTGVASLQSGALWCSDPARVTASCLRIHCTDRCMAWPTPCLAPIHAIINCKTIRTYIWTSQLTHSARVQARHRFMGAQTIYPVRACPCLVFPVPSMVRTLPSNNCVALP